MRLQIVLQLAMMALLADDFHWTGAYIGHCPRLESIRCCWWGSTVCANYRKIPVSVPCEIVLCLEGCLPLWHLHVDLKRQHV